jgi:hypothetical protein
VAGDAPGAPLAAGLSTAAGLSVALGEAPGSPVAPADSVTTKVEPSSDGKVPGPTSGGAALGSTGASVS